MQKKRKTKLLYFCVIPLILLILFVSFLSRFEYTAVADMKESLVEADKREPLAYGKVLFETRGCIGCHAIDPKGESFGPNLSGLAGRTTKAYIRESIVSPDAVIVKGFPDLTMPNFGEILNDSQVDALVKYVSSLK